MRDNIAVVGFVLCGACGQDIATTSADAGGSATSDSAVITGDARLAGFQCRPPVTQGLGAGMHNAGLDCRGNCHDHGFTVAGTLFSSADSAQPLAGATITLLDNTGKELDLVSQLNGNFFTREPVAYPLTVYVSACPNVAHMPIGIPATNGAGCNQSGCHASVHVHLP